MFDGRRWLRGLAMARPFGPGLPPPPLHPFATHATMPLSPCGLRPPPLVTARLRSVELTKMTELREIALRLAQEAELSRAINGTGDVTEEAVLARARKYVSFLIGQEEGKE
jgi:hypothetical protein